MAQLLFFFVVVDRWACPVVEPPGYTEWGREEVFSVSRHQIRADVHLPLLPDLLDEIHRVSPETRGHHGFGFVVLARDHCWPHQEAPVEALYVL